jgi:histidinol-phosphatase (PHP family)
MYSSFLDHHVHSSFSMDSESSLEALVAQARKVGLGGFVVTDHLEFDKSDPGFGAYRYAEAREAWEELQEVVPDLRVRFGAEVSHQQKSLPAIRDFLQIHRFHWVIGSAHYVGREEISTYISRVEGEGLPLGECLNEYFDVCLKAVESNLYDCLGHLDFPKRYSRLGPALTGAFWLQHYRKPILDILTACLDMGVFLEVNTGTYRVGFDEPYPGWAILDAYRELGGREVVLSSDAHRPEDLGTAFGAVMKGLVQRGLTVRNGVV